MITLVTDGAYSSKHKVGGWSCIVVNGELEAELSGYVLDNEKQKATNNRMELLGVIEGFKYIVREYTKPMKIVVVTDSAYVYKAMVEHWPVKWDFRNWRTSTGMLVKNRDLWEDLQALSDPFPVTWTHTRGHSGNIMNDRADALAVAAREAGYLENKDTHA